MSEAKAYALMTQGDADLTSRSVQDIHDKADELILLAEKIKAERATIAMQDKQKL